VSAAGEVRRVSAIAPVRNEARHIEGRVGRLFERTHPPDHLKYFAPSAVLLGQAGECAVAICHRA